MEDGQTISYYGIQKEVTITLTPTLSFYSGGHGTKKLFGLESIAYAISLWDWDGIMPGLVSLTLVVYRQVDLQLLLRVIMQVAFDCPRATL